jgi:hypothetical protein
MSDARDLTIRDRAGRFQLGTKAGPGRPRRAVEQDYLVAIAEGVPPDAWRRIIARAVADAEAGDDKARAWLSRHLCGPPGSGLAEIAACETAGVDPIQSRANELAEAEFIARLFSGGFKAIE